MYGSAVIALVGMPASGYSVALALGAGSFYHKRSLIAEQMEQLQKFKECNKKTLKLMKEKEDILRKIIDT